MSRDCPRTARRPAGARAGFTLLEVLLVLVILGVIAALVVPRLLGTQDQAMIDNTRIRIRQVEQAVSIYKVQHESLYPETLDELVTPLDRNGQPMEPYEREYPLDAWRQPLSYALEADETGTLRPLIWSNGPNGIDDNGGGDDINNWTE